MEEKKDIYKDDETFRAALQDLLNLKKGGKKLFTPEPKQLWIPGQSEQGLKYEDIIRRETGGKGRGY